MLGLLLNAVILIVLIKTVSNRDVDMLTAGIMAVVVSIVGGALAFGLVLALGIAGLFLAGIITAAALGFAISAFLGIDMQRSMIIGVVFMIVNIGVSIFFHVAMRPTP
jgi:hypothetical protein